MALAARKTLDAIQRFVRATFFGFTSLLVLLGAGVVNPDPDALTIAVLVIVAMNFHVFGYVHNDLVDLAVDRTAPLRASDPLVTGLIRPAHALALACAQIPISFALTLAVATSWHAPAVLLLGYVATVLYNLYGKRCRVPIVTDAVQGIAWISIALYGSLLVGEMSALSLVVAAFGFGFIFLINGVHGGLRDLANDLRHHRWTTAILLGARPVDQDRVRSSLRLQAFAAVPLSIMVVPLAAALFSGLGYARPTELLVVASFTVVVAVNLWFWIEVVRTDQHNEQRRKAIYGSAFFLLLMPLIVLTPLLAVPLRITTMLCFFVPMLVFQDRVSQIRALLRAGAGNAASTQPTAR
jgi:4-hydroxybenzoate polyprenyltransferase